jgi:hypothetical protein
MTRWSRFRRLLGPEPQADAELAFHLEMRTRELVEQGVSPDRARELASRRFGDYDHPRDECIVLSKRRARVQSALRESTRAGASSRGQRLRSALVVAEIALAVVLLTGAGLREG